MQCKKKKKSSGNVMFILTNQNLNTPVEIRVDSHTRNDKKLNASFFQR